MFQVIIILLLIIQMSDCLFSKLRQAPIHRLLYNLALLNLISYQLLFSDKIILFFIYTNYIYKSKKKFNKK